MSELEGISRSHVRLPDTIVRQLTRHIVSQDLRPGHALPSEAELGRRFEVSKTVVREALRQLAALGIIDIKHGKVPTVGDLRPDPLRHIFRFALHISPDGLREAVELRRGVERQAVLLAAEHATADELAELEQIMDQLEHATAHDDWVAVDLAFHQCIARLSHNPLIEFMIYALADSMREVISTLHSQTRVRSHDATVARHRMIVDAIRTHDAAAAAAAMDQHFTATDTAIMAARAAPGEARG